jgi:hypothetical protein
MRALEYNDNQVRPVHRPGPARDYFRYPDVAPAVGVPPGGRTHESTPQIEAAHVALVMSASGQRRTFAGLARAKIWWAG